jgi:hypothetical protein
VTVAQDMTEHLRHLQYAVIGEWKVGRKARGFVTTFLEPLGLSRRVDRIVTRELEALALGGKRP